MNYLSNNLLTILKRWPEIADLLQTAHYDLSQVELVADKECSLVFDSIQIASSFDQVEEANIQISQITNDTDVVTLYGTGLGKVQQQLLLCDNLLTLNVVILNMALFKASLSYFDHLGWLQDPRINLLTPLHNNRITNQPTSMFIALPAELVLAENDSARLRDRICLALDSEFIEQSSGSKNKELVDKIDDNLAFINEDHDVCQLISSAQKSQYIICGAGPTLVEHFTWLKRPEIKAKYTLIAVDAAVQALYQEDIIPNIIVSIDPRAKTLFEGFNEKVPLVYFPVVDGDFLINWPGERYVAYSTGALYHKINERLPKGRLYCGGSVIHPAIDLAVHMKAKKVVLLGADFSFPGEKSHAYWEEDRELVSAKSTQHWVLNAENVRVPTLLNYRGYLRDLEQYIELAKHVSFFNGSKKGALIAGTTILDTSL